MSKYQEMFFKLNHADFPPLLKSTVSKPVSSVSSSLSCTKHLLNPS